MSKIHLDRDGNLRALTVREPYATAILMGFKPIENRTLNWPNTLPLPMTLAIHASTDDSTFGTDVNELLDLDRVIEDAFCNPNYEMHSPGREYVYGGTIIGLVDVIACVCVSEMSDDELVAAIDKYHWADGPQNPTAKRSDWANGPYCLILDNPRRFRTGVVCSGQLNYWRVPDAKRALMDDTKLLLNPQDLPTMPIGGVPKWLGRKPKKAKV